MEHFENMFRVLGVNNTDRRTFGGMLGVLPMTPVATSAKHNGVARIFFWGGQTFFFGVVADIFRDRRKPSRFSGGGVVAEIFRDRRKPGRFSGGG